MEISVAKLNKLNNPYSLIKLFDRKNLLLFINKSHLNELIWKKYFLDFKLDIFIKLFR